MAKKAMLPKLNPKLKGKVQKSKVQKLTLLATSESLAEREYTCVQNMDLQTLVEGTDLNMIKQEEIKLETETMECDEIGQLPSNSVPITSEEFVKNEPESFVVKEEVSNPVLAKTTISIPTRKQRKNVAKEKLKLTKAREKIAKEQEKRQNKRARNPARHEENIAQLPDYSEISLSLNQELSDTNLNDNGVKSCDEIQRNVAEISNTEAELNSGTSSNNVSSIDISNGQESNTGDAETQNLHIMDTSVSCDTSHEVDRLTNVDEPDSETVINEVEELNSSSSFDIDSEANTGHNLHFSDTLTASDTNQTVNSTIAESATNIGGKRHKCSHCSYASNNSTNFLNHSRIHTGEKPFKCSQCSYVSADAGSLKLHMRTHTGEKPYKCNQCSFAAARAIDLKNHISTHTGEKPYKCNQCSYASAQFSSLKKHVRSHTGEKPYKCTECSFATTQGNNLKTHILTHSGGMPFKCSQCSYACVHTSNLKRHMRTHNGEKPHKCSQCSYASVTTSALKKHMGKHSGEKPYKCSQCSYTCAHPGYLQKHMRSHT